MIREATENRFELIHILANQERICAKYNVSVNVKSKSQEFRPANILSACIGNNHTLHSKKPMNIHDVDLSLALISHVIQNMRSDSDLQEIAAALSLCCSTGAPQILWVLEHIIYEIPGHSLVLSKDRDLWSKPNLYRWDYYEVENVSIEDLNRMTHSGMDVNDVIILE